MDPTLITRQLPSGRFKAYVWKQHSDHIFDWNGSNYRRVGIPGQPRLGYATREEAEAFARSLPREIVADLAMSSDGTHMSEMETPVEVRPAK